MNNKTKLTLQLSKQEIYPMKIIQNSIPIYEREGERIYLKIKNFLSEYINSDIKIWSYVLYNELICF